MAGARWARGRRWLIEKNNFIDHQLRGVFTARKASMSSYLETFPSPSSSSISKMLLISLWEMLTLTFRSWIILQNSGKSMKLFWF